MPEAPIPPTPEIQSFVVVGLNAIIRNLEGLSQSSRPGAHSELQPSDPLKAAATNKHFSAIFVTSSLPSIVQAQLPQLVATASLAHPNDTPTRLVQLPKGCEARINNALGLPNVSLVGLLTEAPRSKGLVDLIQAAVRAIEIPWLQEIKKGIYLPVKINAIETTMPVTVKEKKWAVQSTNQG